ncbi:tail fiber domain-containing protein [Klebsiella oxytoca]|uniref:tail fiber domain-containing protein n=1 Tax=Klebsiella oxytoca TaxID=571 RepID=UPI00388D93C1
MDTTLSNASDYDQTVHAVRLLISQLKPVSYKFLDTARSAGKRYSFGGSAQEVEKVLPELVNTLSDGHKARDHLAVLGLLLA